MTGMIVEGDPMTSCPAANGFPVIQKVFCLHAWPIYWNNSFFAKYCVSLAYPRDENSIFFSNCLLSLVLGSPLDPPLELAILCSAADSLFCKSFRDSGDG
jgi:hypothetical protein